MHADANLSEPRVEHVRPVVRAGDPHPVKREADVAFARNPPAKSPDSPHRNLGDVLARTGAVDVFGIVAVEDPAGAGHRAAVTAAEAGIAGMKAQVAQAVLAALAVEGIEVVSHDSGSGPRRLSSWYTEQAPKEPSDPFEQRRSSTACHMLLRLLSPFLLF